MGNDASSDVFAACWRQKLESCLSDILPYCGFDISSAHQCSGPSPAHFPDERGIPPMAPADEWFKRAPTSSVSFAVEIHGKWPFGRDVWMLWLSRVTRTLASGCLPCARFFWRAL